MLVIKISGGVRQIKTFQHCLSAVMRVWSFMDGVLVTLRVSSSSSSSINQFVTYTFEKQYSKQFNDCCYYLFCLTDVDMKTYTAKVYFKQLNDTVSRSYCTNPGCISDTGGNYSYSIPISPMFPRLFLTLKFLWVPAETTSFPVLYFVTSLFKLFEIIYI